SSDLNHKRLSPQPTQKEAGAEKKPASVDASGLFQLIRVSDHQQHIRMARHPRRTPARQITARQPGTRLVDKPRLVHHPHAVPIHRHLMRLAPTPVRRAPVGPLPHIAATNTSPPVRATPSPPPTAHRPRAWSTNPDWCTTHTRYRSTAT